MPTFWEPDASEVRSHEMMLGWLSGLYPVVATAAWRVASSAACCEAEAVFFVQSRDAIFFSRDIMIGATAGHGSDDLLKVGK